MALTVVNQWTATAADVDAEITTVPTPGNWLVAVVTWHVIDGSAPLMNLGDFSRNLWTLLYTTSKQAWISNNSAQLQAQVWACPAVKFDGWAYLNVYAAAMAISASDVGTVAINVFEVSGMANGWITVDSVTTTKPSAATTASITIPAPAGAANCLMVAVAGTDNTSGTISATGTLTALTQATGSAPSVTCAGAWKESTASQTASWSSTVACNWAAVAVALRVTGTGPAQQSPNWPAQRLLVGLGYQASSPLGYVTWTDQSTRLTADPGNTSLSGTRGIPYDQQQANSEQSRLSIRNDDGVYTPRTAGAGPASANGTTTTVLLLDADAVNINVGDFFQLFTSAGVLKEFTVFQVLTVVSSAGTTTVTFTKADGTGGGALVSTATGDLYDGIPIDMGIPWQYRMYWQGKEYPVMTGSLYELLVAFVDPHWSDVAAANADSLAALANTANPSVVRKEILRRNPYCYWPLSDPAGAAVAQNASGNSLTQLALTASKFGTGTGGNEQAVFGASTQNVPLTAGSSSVNSLYGDSGSGWQQSGLTSTDMNNKAGWALVGYDGNMPPISGGVTIVGSVFIPGNDLSTIAASTVDPTVVILRNANPGQGSGGSVIKLSIDHTVWWPKVTVWDKTTHVATTTTCTGTATFGAAFVVYALTFNQSGWTLYFGNGVSGSGSANLPASFSQLDVGGEADQFYNGNCFSGIHAHLAIFGRQLTAKEASNLNVAYQVGRVPQPGLSADPTSYRIQRTLAATGVTTPRVITSSDVLCALEDSGDKSVAASAANVAGYEDGLWFGDSAGQVQFRSAGDLYHQYVKATLGDGGGGEIPYEAGQTYSRDRKLMYNNVAVANTKVNGFSAPTPATLIATNDASQAKYGPSTLPRNVFLDNYGDAFDLAWWLLGRFASPQMYVPTVTINAATDPTRWAFCLGVEVGDLIVVNKRQLATTPPISIRCRVLQVTPDVGPFRALWTLVVAPAPSPVPILNDPTYGTIGGEVLGA